MLRVGARRASVGMARCWPKAQFAAGNRFYPRRSMGSSGHGGYHVSAIHQNIGMVYVTVMWLWMMYRAKEDGAVVLGLVHPWDAHGGGHGHGDHGDGHGHDDHGAHDGDDEDEDDDDDDDGDVQDENEIDEGDEETGDDETGDGETADDETGDEEEAEEEG